MYVWLHVCLVTCISRYMYVWLHVGFLPCMVYYISPCTSVQWESIFENLAKYLRSVVVGIPILATMAVVVDRWCSPVIAW